HVESLRRERISEVVVHSYNVKQWDIRIYAMNRVRYCGNHAAGCRLGAYCERQWKRAPGQVGWRSQLGHRNIEHSYGFRRVQTAFFYIPNYADHLPYNARKESHCEPFSNRVLVRPEF